MPRWFFECFEQRVGRADCHAVGFIDEHDLEASDQRTIDDLLLETADLLNLDLRIGQLAVRFDQGKVRVCERFNLRAGAAEATGIRALHVLAFFAIEGLGESHGCEALADPLFAMKQIGMRDPVMLHGGLQNGLGSFMADDFVKHGLLTL